MIEFYRNENPLYRFTCLTVLLITVAFTAYISYISGHYIEKDNVFKPAINSM